MIKMMGRVVSSQTNLIIQTWKQRMKSDKTQKLARIINKNNLQKCEIMHHDQKQKRVRLCRLNQPKISLPALVE